MKNKHVGFLVMGISIIIAIIVMIDDYNTQNRGYQNQQGEKYQDLLVKFGAYLPESLSFIGRAYVASGTKQSGVLH